MKRTAKPTAPHAREVRASATLAIQERSRALRAAGEDVIQLGFGQSPFPVPDVVVEALRAHADEKAYLPVHGLPALRDSVAEYHARLHGVAYHGEQVLVGPGSKELMFLLQLVLLGETWVPAPAWVSYGPQARLAGKAVRMLATRREFGYRLQPNDLMEACRSAPAGPRLLVLNSPNNPTGVAYDAETLAALAEIARKEGIIVLSDEIYGELSFRGEHTSIARHYPEGTIIATGLSKWCAAGGWRLGTLTIPKELRGVLDAVAGAASETFTSTSAPVQYAAVRAFQPCRELDEYLEQVRGILRALCKECRVLLEDVGAYVVEPEAAFYLFPDFAPVANVLRANGIADSAVFAERLLNQQRVASLPGTEFGMSADQLVLRLALVDFDGKSALRAASAGFPLGLAFLEEYCPRCIEGVRRLARWVAEVGSSSSRPWGR